jgi:hypothetical protein
MTDLEALKAAALAATPGERKFEPHPYGYGYSVLWVPETRAEILVTGGTNDGDNPITWMGEELTDGDRDFIEAANPAAILALIEMYEEAKADADRFRWCFEQTWGVLGKTLDERRDAIDAAMKEQGA